MLFVIRRVGPAFCPSVSRRHGSPYSGSDTREQGRLFPVQRRHPRNEIFGRLTTRLVMGSGPVISDSRRGRSMRN